MAKHACTFFGCAAAQVSQREVLSPIFHLRIGLVEHPDWYSGLDRKTANRGAIQDKLR